MAAQAGIDERIREFVGQHREELADLVHQVVDAELEQLVAADLEHRSSNGVRDHAQPEAAPATKVCAGPCGRELALSEFEPRRRMCKRCRREQRRGPAAVSRPVAEPGPEPEPVINGRSPEVDQWLLTEGLAEQTPGGLVATERGYELGAGID